MKKVAIVLISLFINIMVVNGATNPYKSSTQWGTNCTWYVWQQVYDRLGITLPGMGNASTWYATAQSKGFNVGSTPKANSIVVWSWYYNGTNYGHVGFVERVDGDTIYVWESDYQGCIDRSDPEYLECEANSVSEETSKICTANAKKTACAYPASYWSSPGDLIGYIYLDYIPDTKTSETKTETEKKQNESVKEKEKSSNNNLKAITINGEELEINSDTLEYEIVLEYEIDKVLIEYTLEDTSASVEELEEQELTEGENTFTILVTAENGDTKEYKIKVIRKELTEVEEIEDETIIEEVKDSKSNLIAIVIGIVVTIVIIILVVILLIKRKKKKQYGK